MSEKVINIQREVNPHFKRVWNSKKSFNVLKGGRNSFKSSVIALLLVFKMIWYISRGEKANIVVIRKVANTLRDSVFLKIQWALLKFFILDQFKITVAPFRIKHEKTGSCFYFYGQDDFQKLKSNDIGNLIAVWYEEAAEFENYEEFDQTNVTFMRQKHPLADKVQIFWSFNPPRNPYSWINEWVEMLKGQKDYLIDESTYLDDELGFVTDQMISEIERIKENDFDYYRYLYLGEAVGLGSNVYNASHFHPISALPEGEKLVARAYAVDGGHQQSATTCSLYVITNKRNVVLLDTLYYSPAGKVEKKAPSDLSKMIYEFILKHNDDDRYKNLQVIKRTIDSAEGAIRNQYYKDYKIRWNPVAKNKKQIMIDYVYSLLAEGRFYYLDIPSNKIFIKEHRNYRYDEKKMEKNPSEPEVVKIDDHTCDGFQYFVMDNLSVLGLKN